MRFLILTWLTLFVPLNHSAAVAVDEPEFPPRIVRMQDGQTVTVEDLVPILRSFDVIYLGEEHDSDFAHQFQVEIIRALLAADANIAISMEMFERDVQGVLNDYLVARVSEEEFLAQSRPWGNYAKHYRDIIELAREYEVPVIAGNVPRPLAAATSKGETLDSSQAPFHARYTTAPRDLYWQKFAAVMKGHGGVDNEESSYRMYQSQCLKDDTMAESIADFLASNRHRHVTVVHLCGKFHSDYGLGTASRVMARDGLVRHLVISTERVPLLKDFDYKKQQTRAHYMMVVPPNIQREID